MMPDLKKAIEALEHCIQDDCEGCPYDGVCRNRLYALDNDILALLREQEQEPVEAITDSECEGNFGSWWYACGGCHGVIDYKDKFCRHCGKVVKWDA